MKVHGAFAPTRRLALVALLAAPAWLLSGSHAGLAVPVAVVLAILAVTLADALFAPAARDVGVERVVPATIGLGDWSEGAYRLRSRWPRVLRVTLHDALPDAIAREPVGPLRLELGPGELRDLPVALVGRARGVHALGAVALRVAGPLGLVARTLRYTPDDALTVAPSIAGVRRYRLLALQHRLRDEGVRTIRRRGAGTTFANLREYAVGDDPRHVDWKATARRRKPIVREYTVEQGQTVIILVDAGRMMTQLAGTLPQSVATGALPRPIAAGALPRFEYALSSALVLADVAVHSGDQVGLLVFDDEVRAFVPPAKGQLALQRVRDALVPVEPAMVEPDYAAAFRLLDTRHRKRSLVVLFTDVIDVRASQALIAHTTRGAARHLPLVVALRNDALVDAAHPTGRDTPDTLYQAAAAEELLAARDEALLTMRQAGVSVLDTAPQTMTAAVVNRYLEVKGRGAL